MIGVITGALLRVQLYHDRRAEGFAMIQSIAQYKYNTNDTILEHGLPPRFARQFLEFRNLHWTPDRFIA